MLGGCVHSSIRPGEFGSKIARLLSSVDVHSRKVGKKFPTTLQGEEREGGGLPQGHSSWV